eukprot:GHVT01041804.1.p1 GENE.GHVT01041804.1~~GHVT01041804.1.p1  ORF type:complete len:390 (-),score=29.06 GHVT01041804.1:2451-3620(-)
MEVPPEPVVENTTEKPVPQTKIVTMEHVSTATAVDTSFALPDSNKIETSEKIAGPAGSLSVRSKCTSKDGKLAPLTDDMVALAEELRVASRQGLLEEVRKLLARVRVLVQSEGRMIRGKDTSDEIPLADPPVGPDAAREQQLVNHPDKMKRTALHLAAFTGHSEIVKILLGAGAQVNATAIDAMTSLHFAAQGGHLDAVNELIRGSANVNSRLSKGRKSVLHLACARAHSNVVEALVAAGADPEAWNGRREKPIDCCTIPDMKQVLQDAINRGQGTKLPKKRPMLDASHFNDDAEEDETAHLSQKTTKPFPTSLITETQYEAPCVGKVCIRLSSSPQMSTKSPIPAQPGLSRVYRGNRNDRDSHVYLGKKAGQESTTRVSTLSDKHLLA